MTEPTPCRPVEMRQAGPYDAALLAVLQAQAFGEDAATEVWGVKGLESLLATPGTLGLIAAAGGEPLGFALARLADGETEVLSIGLIPLVRGRGLGRALLDALIARSRALGASKLFLEVAADNPSALKLYTAAGFFQIGIRRGYYLRPKGRIDALVLRRDGRELVSAL